MNTTRREFIKKIVSIGFFTYSSLTSKFSRLASAQKVKESKKEKSKVVIVRHTGAVEADGKVNQEIVQGMLSEGMKLLTEGKSSPQAWRQFFSPQDTVGLKINGLGRTHPEVTYSVVNGLKSIPIPEENIIIWDRNDRDLVNSGYQINTSSKGVKCYGTTDHTGFDEQEVNIGNFSVRFSKILTTQCSALINLPVLRTLHFTGVSIALKNHLGAVNKMWEFHDDEGDPSIADLNRAEILREKQKLIVCDALIILDSIANRRYPYYGLILSTDPVALDTTGTKIIQKFRDERKLGPITPEPSYIARAADSEHRVGTNDLNRIDLIDRQLD